MKSWWQLKILEKNCRSEDFFLKNLMMENKTSWKYFKLNAAHLCGTKASVSLEKLSPKTSQTFIPQSHNTELLLMEPFWCFWKFLVFLALAVFPEWKRWWTNEGEIKKACRNLFVSLKNFMRGPFCCFWMFVVPQKLCKTGVSRFLVKIFLSDSTKIFHRVTLLFLGKILLSKNFVHKRKYHGLPSRIFCHAELKHLVQGFFDVCEYLYVLGIDCTCNLRIFCGG